MILYVGLDFRYIENYKQVIEDKCKITIDLDNILSPELTMNAHDYYAVTQLLMRGNDIFTYSNDYVKYLFEYLNHRNELYLLTFIRLNYIYHKSKFTCVKNEPYDTVTWIDIINPCPMNLDVFEKL